MKSARRGGSVLWWCVLGASIVAHGLWLYVCSDWVPGPLPNQPAAVTAPVEKLQAGLPGAASRQLGRERKLVSTPAVGDQQRIWI